MAGKKARNIWLDLFRFVLVFLVINIHFNGSSQFLPIFRMAVPMFFMISGYFAYSPDQEAQNKKNARFIKSTLRYLIIGCIIYFVVDFVFVGIGAATGKIETFIQSLILTGGGTRSFAAILWASSMVFTFAASRCSNSLLFLQKETRKSV